MKFYKGVVEDNKDPLKASRVRVRIFEIHSDNILDVPTDTLPWATVDAPTVFGGLHQGIGVSSVIDNGTWVRIYLEDESTSAPVVVSIIPGIHTVKDEGVGFTDPTGVYPLLSRLNEPDMNRLSRVENLSNGDSSTDYKTIHQKIIDNKDTVSATNNVSGADVSQTEPDSTNNLSEYPYATVNETRSGHVVEFDDTPDNERIRYYHKSGSYMEIKPDGSIVHKSVGAENHYIHIGDVNEHIKKGVKRYIEENLDEIIKGSVQRAIEGNISENIIGNRNVQVDSNDTKKVLGDNTENISGNNINTVEGSNTTEINMDDSRKVLGLMTINADGKLVINGEVKIVGGGIEVTGKISSGTGITTTGDVADSMGNLSSLRTAFDSHTHFYVMPVHAAGSGPTAIPTMTDPLVRLSDYKW